MKIFKKLALCLLALLISNYADASKPTFKISNPFDGHMEIKLAGVHQSKSGFVLKLKITKHYEINAKDPSGRGDSRNAATAHKLCYQTSSVNLEIQDANNKSLGTTTVDVPDAGQQAKMVEVQLNNLSRYKSPINLKFDCTPFNAD